jgi:hypothetical protein
MSEVLSDLNMTVPFCRATTSEESMFAALSVLLVVVCLVPAIGKLGAHPRMLSAAGHFGIPWSRYRLIGMAELVAAAGVIVGLIWPPIGVAAAFGMCALLVGALVTHYRSGDAFTEAMPAVLGLGVSVASLAVALGQ